MPYFAFSCAVQAAEEAGAAAKEEAVALRSSTCVPPKCRFRDALAAKGVLGMALDAAKSFVGEADVQMAAEACMAALAGAAAKEGAMAGVAETTEAAMKTPEATAVVLRQLTAAMATAAQKQAVLAAQADALALTLSRGCRCCVVFVTCLSSFVAALLSSSSARLNLFIFWGCNFYNCRNGRYSARTHSPRHLPV